MFKLNGDVLEVVLPEGKTMAELTDQARTEIRTMIREGNFYGKNLKINGRLTTSMAVVLGHELAHVTRSVSIFDPKTNSYVMCIEH